jgi:hypothetical protein
MKTARTSALRGRATVVFLEVLKWRIEASLSGCVVEGVYLLFMKMADYLLYLQV